MKTLRKICWFLFSVPVALIPTEILILIWWFLKPNTFWQKLALLSLGVVVLGSIQILLLVLWLAFLLDIYKEIDKERKFTWRSN